MQIYIRSHFRCHLKGVFRIFLTGNFYPLLFQHRRTVFQRNQRTSSGSCGNDGRSRFSYLIRIFIQRESQHLNSTGVGLIRTPSPLRPVHINGSSGSMSALLVFYIYQIASPTRIIDTELERSLSACRMQTTTGNRSNGTTVNVCSQRFAIVFPPPAPTDAVYLIFQIRTVYQSSFCI